MKCYTITHLILIYKVCWCCTGIRGATGNSVKDRDIDDRSSDSSERRTTISPHDPSFITLFFSSSPTTRNGWQCQNVRVCLCTVSPNRQRQTHSIVIPLLIFCFVLLRRDSRAVSYSLPRQVLPFTHYLTMKCRDRGGFLSPSSSFTCSIHCWRRCCVKRKREKSWIAIMAVLHRRWLAVRLFSTTYIIYEKATLKKLCIEMARSSKKEKGKAKNTFLHVFIAKRLDWLSVACRSFAIWTAVAVPYYNISKDSPAIRPKMMLITIDGYIHVENAKYGLHTLILKVLFPR